MPDFSIDAESSALYALVTYVPEPLGSYLDRVRQRIAPWMPASRAHVTVVAPRPIPAEPEALWADWRRRAAGFSAFEIELASVEVFKDTNVVYLAIEGGSGQLTEMHQLLNSNGTTHRESYPFHPHITLAQEISADQAPAVAREAEAMWEEYRHPRSFTATRFHLVRNETGDSWDDVEILDLG